MRPDLREGCREESDAGLGSPQSPKIFPKESVSDGHQNPARPPSNSPGAAPLGAPGRGLAPCHCFPGPSFDLSTDLWTGTVQSAQAREGLDSPRLAPGAGQGQRTLPAEMDEVSWKSWSR